MSFCPTAASEQLDSPKQRPNSLSEEIDDSESVGMRTTCMFTMRAYTVSQEPISESSRTRKSHKKSRGGCYTCKRRKIKCQENQPACHNCIRINASCKYPPPLVIKALRNPTSALVEARNLQSTPTVFNASDLRLFHHFIINAYPHLPLGNDNVWVREIATFSHSYEFLMHALLALSASHLTTTSTSQLSCQALSHRISAIRGLNKALSKPPESKEDGDAIMGACWALSFQTKYMGESVEEFFTMMRGCILVSNQNWREKFGTSFQNLNHVLQEGIVLPRIENCPLVNQDLVAGARESIQKLGGLNMDAVERQACHILDEIVRQLSISSLKAYLKYRDLHAFFALLPHASFQDFVHPTNAIAQILMAHYAAILLVMAPITSREWEGRNMGTPNRNTIFKLDNIWNNVPGYMREYLQWPMRATGSIPGVSP